MPMRALAMIGVTEDGDIYNGYYNASAADKILMSGLIQQDAMIDTLEAAGLINATNGDEEEENDGEEE